MALKFNLKIKIHEKLFEWTMISTANCIHKMFWGDWEMIEHTHTHTDWLGLFPISKMTPKQFCFYYDANAVWTFRLKCSSQSRYFFKTNGKIIKISTSDWTKALCSNEYSIFNSFSSCFFFFSSLSQIHFAFVSLSLYVSIDKCTIKSSVLSHRKFYILDSNFKWVVVGLVCTSIQQSSRFVTLNWWYGTFSLNEFMFVCVCVCASVFVAPVIENMFANSWINRFEHDKLQ